MSIMLCGLRLVWRNSASEIFLKLSIRNQYNMTFAGDVARPIISAEIVPGIMRDPDADAIVFRKYGTTLRESV